MNLHTDNMTAIETTLCVQAHSEIIDFETIAELDESLDGYYHASQTDWFQEFAIDLECEVELFVFNELENEFHELSN